MNRKQKRQIVQIAKKVAKKVVQENMGRIKKQILSEIKGQQRQPQRQQRQQQPQPQQGGQQQPMQHGGNPLEKFKQIQESSVQQSAAGNMNPSQAQSAGQQMSEQEMIQYAENLDPNGASPNTQPDPTGGTIRQGQNESKQQFMQRLQQATGGKDPKEIFEQSEKKKGSGGWRPGQS